jgi:hypothetical protein
MPSYRPLPMGKAHTYFGLQGQILAGGSMKFYQAGTTTPQSVYGDPELSVNNGSQIALDSAGRPTVDVWASTANRFFIEWYDASSVKQYDLDDVEVPGGAGQVVPVPGENEVLGGDGDNFVLLDVTNKWLPDMAGNANKILGTDGSLASWIAKPADGTAGVSDIQITASSVKLSNGSNHSLRQFKADTVTGTSALEVSKSITFDTAYSSAPKVLVTVTGTNASAASNVEVHARVSAISTTGFTVVFSNRTGGSSADLSGNGLLTGTVSFNWEAIGPTAS